MGMKPTLSMSRPLVQRRPARRRSGSGAFHHGATPRSSQMIRAALYPGHPVMFPPGCAAPPWRYTLPAVEELVGVVVGVGLDGIEPAVVLGERQQDVPVLLHHVARRLALRVLAVEQVRRVQPLPLGEILGALVGVGEELV